MQVLKFSAAWCQPCKLLSKTLDRVAKDIPGIEVVEIDVERSPAIARHHNIRSVPVLVAGDRRLQGNVSEDALRRWLVGLTA